MMASTLNDPIVMENILGTAAQDDLERLIFGHQFPWYYNANTNAHDAATRSGDSPQFVHGFVQDRRDMSRWAAVPGAVLTPLGLTKDKLLRAKANLLPRSLQPMIHPDHIDDSAPHWVMVYYVNDADGDTCLFDDSGNVTHRIHPRKGRAVVFDGRWRHASSSPVDTAFRCVINYNLSPQIPASLFEKFAQ